MAELISKFTEEEKDAIRLIIKNRKLKNNGPFFVKLGPRKVRVNFRLQILICKLIGLARVTPPKVEPHITSPVWDKFITQVKKGQTPLLTYEVIKELIKVDSYLKGSNIDNQTTENGEQQTTDTQTIDGGLNSTS